MPVSNIHHKFFKSIYSNEVTKLKKIMCNLIKYCNMFVRRLDLVYNPLWKGGV